jgi:hypothetical protein
LESIEKVHEPDEDEEADQRCLAPYKGDGLHVFDTLGDILSGEGIIRNSWVSIFRVRVLFVVCSRRDVLKIDIRGLVRPVPEAHFGGSSKERENQA